MGIHGLKTIEHQVGCAGKMNSIHLIGTDCGNTGLAGSSPQYLPEPKWTALVCKMCVSEIEVHFEWDV